MFNWEIMSWLIKDPIVTVTWLNFDHAQSNNTKLAKKIKLPQLKFFPEKQANKIFMHLLAPFILRNSEKVLRANPELQGCAIFEPKMSIRPEQFFLVQTIIITFIYHYYYFHHLPFQCAKFKKNSYGGFRAIWMHHFWVQNGPFATNKSFFWKKLLISFSSTSRSLLLSKIFKKVLQ